MFQGIDRPRAYQFDPKFFLLKEKWEHDFQIARNVGDRFNFYLGVNNFTDEKPSVDFGGNYPVSAVGRYYSAGVKVGLDKIF